MWVVALCAEYDHHLGILMPVPSVTLLQHYYYYINLTAFFQDNLGKPAPEMLTILDFTEARDDGWQWHQLNHMQIIYTSPRQITTQFVQARCPSCHPTNSVKALKEGIFH